jgi:hypothetical protein
MNIWKRLGAAGLVAGALSFGGQDAFAACIDPNTNTVANAADCLFGDGGADDCLLAISVDWSGTGTPPPDPKKMVCTDGDTSCDRDGAVNGRCEFSVGACVNLAGCVAENVSEAFVTKPSQKDVDKAHKNPQSVRTRNDLQFALNELLPTAVAGQCTDDDISVRVPLKSKGGFCGPDSPLETKCVSDGDCVDYCIPVFKKNKVSIAIEATGTTDDATSKFKFTCNPDEDGFTNGAQAFQIASASDLIGGPLAMGKIGDFAIRNGNVRAVVRNIGREHSFMLQNGGQIIDADLGRVDPADDRDSWTGIQPMINTASSQATDFIEVENDGSNGNAAVIRSTGPDDLLDSIKGDVLILAAGLALPNSAVDQDLNIALETRLILPPYSNKIEIATKVMNMGGALSIYIGDFINPSGQLEPFGPGQGYGEQQIRNGATNASAGQPLDFMAYQGMLDAAGVTYGLIFPATPPFNAGLTAKKTGLFSSSGVNVWVHNNDLLNGVLFPDANASKQAGGFTIPAMSENTLRRWFTIGETVNDITRERTKQFNQVTSIVQGVVTIDGEPAAGAHVTIGNNLTQYASVCDDYSTNCKNVYSSTLTDEMGFYRLTVPEGEWNVFVRKKGAPYEGSASTPTAHAVLVEEKKVTLLNVDLDGTGTIVVNVEDQAGNPVAGKVSIVGVPASPDPLNDEFVGLLSTKFVGRYFGYDFVEKGDIFGLADARFADASGTTGEFMLEPGTYHVVVSKGYEYDVYDEAITVTAGNTSTVNAVVNQVVDTTGFVSIDTHVHMINSPDSTVSRTDRITTMIAEGVDFFVNTDHDFAHDLSDEIADMGVSALVANRPSAETTTSHYGHFNMWPITVNSEIDGGVYDWSAHNGLGDGYPTSGRYDSNPSEIYAAGHAYPGTQVVQINHFNSGTLGHFNMMGIDTLQNPPTSSNDVYRCVGGSTPGRPCEVQICIDGTNDGNACTMDAQCPGGACPGVSACSGAGTCTLSPNLGQYLRLDPLETNFYDDNFTALEVWIEAGRGQTDLLRGDNMADWFNLMNQGRFKAGIADSDTHSSISVQSGGPRTFVASSTDAPASIDPEELAVNVNGLRAIGSNGPFMRVELENGAAQTASHAVGDDMTVTYSGGGADSINLHIEAPTWAEYDTIDVYMNSTTNCESEWTFFGVINPSKCDTVAPTLTLTKSGVDGPTTFTVTTSPGVSGSGTRQVTDKSIPVTIGADTWVVVVVRGTDGVSKPMFPMLPQDLDTANNDDLADLTDSGGPLPWNLNEEGALALAFSNPLFFDSGDNVCHGGTACP